MGAAPFELLVDSIREGVLVATNCGATDIPLGTTFTAARRVRAGADISPPQPGDGPLALTVIGVRWYDREVAAVPGGHSAGVVVSGPGLEWVEHTLRDLPHGELLILVAGAIASAEPRAAADRGLISDS